MKITEYGKELRKKLREEIIIELKEEEKRVNDEVTNTVLKMMIIGITFTLILLLTLKIIK